MTDSAIDAVEAYKRIEEDPYRAWCGMMRQTDEPSPPSENLETQLERYAAELREGWK